MAILFICTIYLVAILLARYLWIVLPNNRYLNAYIAEIQSQFNLEQETPQQQSEREISVRKEIKHLFARINHLVPDECKIRRWLISGTGRQLAAWRLAHRAKCLVFDILDQEALDVYQLTARERLKQLEEQTGNTLAKEIHKAMDKTPNNPTRLRYLLKEAYELLFDVRDGYFETLADWQNKAMWLAMVGLSMIVVLGLAAGNTFLFMLGAVGGLLGRLRKALIRKNIGFDYGMSWSTLFLSPLVGALTGWAGVILTFFLVDIGVLDSILSPLKNTQWAAVDQNSTAMALAVAFGVSATLFERMIEHVVGNLTASPEITIKKKPSPEPSIKQE